MEKQIQKQLKEWKKLRASKGYLESSLYKILQTPQAGAGFSISSFLYFRAAAGILAIFLVAVISVVSMNGGAFDSGSSVASLENESLETEIQTVDVQIQLNEVNYYSDSAERVASALDEVATD